MEINESNLLLYLKGDDFTDSSTYNHTITNHGTGAFTAGPIATASWIKIENL